MAHTLYIVGIGPGNPDYVVPRGLNLIKHATVLVGSERSLEDFQEPGQITYPVTGKLSVLAEQIERELINHCLLYTSTAAPNAVAKPTAIAAQAITVTIHFRTPTAKAQKSPNACFAYR